MASSGGHVFVVPGDLRRLSCDAWLLPTDIGGSIARGWLGWPLGSTREEDRRRIGDVHLGADRVRRIESWGDDRPALYLGNLFGGERGIERFIACARRFLEVATPECRARRFVPHRARPLLALPLVGSRFGGGASVAGDILQKLLPMLQASALELDVDVALVVYEEAPYAAAQALRRQDPTRWWPTLTALSPALDRLVALARDERLVVFFGAGASVGAGLPMWDDLLEGLAHDAGLGSDLPALRRLGVLDRARLIERAFDRRAMLSSSPAATLRATRPMAEQIAQRFDVSYASLLHHLMAALPVREFVTTNFDDLFEIAAEGFHPELSVLPHAAQPAARRWLLKMHGCITRPTDIVLTRDDYLRYEQQRAALAGIVQALLITRHMLFIGFSLADDNFHRIVDAVRRAVSVSSPASEFGSVLTLAHDRVSEELWQNELDFIPMAPPYADGIDDATFNRQRSENARTLEIFLDALAARSASTSNYLLREDYDASLGPRERLLAHELLGLLERCGPEIRATESWDEVRKLYARLGLGPRHDPRDRDAATARRRRPPS